ncbi:MAG: beta-lactamase family protein [Deltaproteobacteria bacterium]|nr:beta-lactamase family protein [Deltaproteobacteria bacterium]
MTRWYKTVRIILGAALIGLMVSLALAAESGPLTPETVDGIVKPIMEKARIPGLSIAISSADGRTLERSYGTSNLEHQIPVTRESIFEIGSLTKTFTALAILLLEEEGKLRVDDKLSKYFPGFRGGEEITLRHLLQHTSGIKEILQVEPFGTNQEKDWRPQEVVKMLESLPLDFEPGQRAQYNNSGCMLLGLVIEKVSGVAYGDFLAERIVKPLGMMHTQIGRNDAVIRNRVTGYELNTATGSMRNAKYTSLVSPYASGGLLSTPADLIKLKKALRPGALLKPASLEAMFAPVRLNNGQKFEQPGTGMTFGYCLELLKFGEQVVPGKTGGISGFNAYFAYLPQWDFMVAVTGNLQNSLGALIEISGAILKIELNRQ